MLVAGFEAFARVEKFANVIEFIDLDVPHQKDSHTYGWRVIYNAKILLDHYYMLISMVLCIIYYSIHEMKKIST